jgi:SAM-dependent methyltransferase
MSLMTPPDYIPFNYLDRLEVARPLIPPPPIADRLAYLRYQRELTDFAVAKECSPHGDDATVASNTVALVGLGTSVFQLQRLAPTEAGHVAALLEAFDLPPGATVLDAGCGVGGVAVHMKTARPDLDLILLNVSRAQLGMCPAGFRTIAADFHEIPLEPASVDVVMFLYTMGYGFLPRVLSEAARVLRPGGSVCIYDLTTEGTSERLIAAAGYKAHTIERIREVAEDAGLTVDRCDTPEVFFTDHFEKIAGPDFPRDVFAELRPALLRLLKVGHRGTTATNDDAMPAQAAAST